MKQNPGVSFEKGWMKRLGTNRCWHSCHYLLNGRKRINLPRRSCFWKIRVLRPIKARGTWRFLSFVAFRCSQWPRRKIPKIKRGKYLVRTNPRFQVQPAGPVHSNIWPAWPLGVLPRRITASVTSVCLSQSFSRRTGVSISEVHSNKTVSVLASIRAVFVFCLRNQSNM